MRVCIKIVDWIKDPLGDQPGRVLGRNHWLSWGFMLPMVVSCFGSADPSNLLWAPAEPIARSPAGPAESSTIKSTKSSVRSVLSRSYACSPP